MSTPGCAVPWEGADGRWAQLSVRFTARSEPAAVAGTVSMAVTCSDDSNETLAVVVDFVTPLQRLLASAVEPD